jgi:quercetin dioxygenase-like cupin family protein
MTIIVNHGHGALEQDALAELEHEGFVASAVDYAPGSTQPHHHEYDVCLHVLEGEFRLTDVERQTVHRCGPGTRVFVASGTEHFEDHGELRMAVGRRNAS